MDILTYIIIGIVLLAIIGLAVYYIIKFLKMSNDEKKEFLLPLIKGLIAEAEKKVGAGHGSEKFKIVEDNFKKKAPIIYKIVLKLLKVENLKDLIELGLKEIKDSFEKKINSEGELNE